MTEVSAVVCSCSSSDVRSSFATCVFSLSVVFFVAIPSHPFMPKSKSFYCSLYVYSMMKVATKFTYIILLLGLDL